MERRADRRAGGVVLGADDPGFAEELRTNNHSLTHRPQVVVAAADETDVVDAVVHAARRDLSVAVQATGHGMSVPADGVLVSTRRLAGVHLDVGARVARIGAGARWGDVLARTVPHGLAPLHGSSPTVGAAGFTSGGGVGPLGRLHGYGADRVRSLRIVTADGVLRTVSPSEDPDLFWAVRGGRVGLGVVTELEVELFEVGDFLGGGLYFDGARADDVVRAYVAWAPGNARETATSLLLVTFPDVDGVPGPLRGRQVAHLRFAHLGDAAEGARRLDAMRDVAPLLQDTVGPMAYDDIAAVHHDPDGPYEVYESGFFVSGVSDERAHVLAQASHGEPMVVELRHHGGAYAEPPPHPNPVRGRDAEFTVYLGSVPTDGATAPERALHTRLRDAFGDADRGTVLNFLGVDTDPRWVRDAFDPADRARLLDVRREVDPHRLFRATHDLGAEEGA